VHPHSGVHELKASGIAGGEDGVEVGGAERGGLLEEHVLAPGGGRGGPAHVEAGGERNVHGVDLRVVEERLIGAVEAEAGGWEAVVGGEEPGLLLGAAADGGDGGTRHEQHGARDLLRDGGAAQDTEPHGAVLRRGGGRHGRRACVWWCSTLLLVRAYGVYVFLLHTHAHAKKSDLHAHATPHASSNSFLCY
jgi:hypothetical protein